MIKAVIFDMDGVLIDAKDWHYEALNKALGLFGYEISRYEHLTIYDGLPTKKKLEMMSVVSGLSSGLHSFINEMKQHYTMDMIYAQCKPRFIHEYALSKLDAAGYKLAVASNSVRLTVETMMQKSRLEQYLDLMLSNEDVKKAKPDPEIYTKAIGHFGFLPAECLVVEDNENGILAAKASGAHLLEVKEVTDVTYQNIMKRIKEIEEA